MQTNKQLERNENRTNSNSNRCVRFECDIFQFLFSVSIYFTRISSVYQSTHTIVLAIPLYFSNVDIVFFFYGDCLFLLSIYHFAFSFSIFLALSSTSVVVSPEYRDFQQCYHYNHTHMKRNRITNRSMKVTGKLAFLAVYVTYFLWAHNFINRTV